LGQSARWGNATLKDDGEQSHEEFFRGGEYGDYLEQFSDAFGLREHIRLETSVERMKRGEDGGWLLSIDGENLEFDAVVVCTGLAARAKPIDTTVSVLSADQLAGNRIDEIRGKTIVVVGGGESAVDYADRLAKEELGNKVYLSLRSGVRVSPRYHPVRGVPSDFLRNRLMLSADPAIRNWLGEKFVRARIRYQRWFELVFPSRKRGGNENKDQGQEQVKAAWAESLTLAAKDDLFNMFHNKSDDFLRAVAAGRISIVGPHVGADFTQLLPFSQDDSGESVTKVRPDFVVPAIGYESTLNGLSSGLLKLSDFYLGCCNFEFENAYAVGFARPIIGNNVLSSVRQAIYVAGLIIKKFVSTAFFLWR